MIGGFGILGRLAKNLYNAAKGAKVHQQQCRVIANKVRRAERLLDKAKDVGSSKASAAGAAVREMNPAFNCTTYSDRVGKDTEGTFTDEFWQGLDITLNALDNVEARKYTDMRSVKARRPLIDSGTTGEQLFGTCGQAFSTNDLLLYRYEGTCAGCAAIFI